MSDQKNWDELYKQASKEVLRWRRKHKRATLTEIEDTVDYELAKMRAKMIEDLALASELANLNDLSVEERPKCPEYGKPLSANGKQKRQLVTEHEQGQKVAKLSPGARS